MERKPFWYRTTVSLELLRQWPAGLGTLDAFLAKDLPRCFNSPHIDVVKAYQADGDAIQLWMLGTAIETPVTSATRPPA